MDKKKKEVKEEDFIRLVKIMDNFVQNYMEFEPESYLYPNWVDYVAKSDKVYMPMGTGGLMRYSEEGKELFKVKPMHVVWIVIGIVVLELILKLFAA